MTQEPLYREGHPKRIEQGSQGVSTDAPSHPRKKKKDDRDLHASNLVAATPESPNDVSVSDAETQSGDEHEPNDNIDSDVHDDAQPSNDKDLEFEHADLDNPQPKKRRYDKNDFAARKHGEEREPWVHKPMSFPPKPSKKKDDEDFERFVEMIRPVFLQMHLTDMLKMSPYAKYMKDIVTNKRRIPEVEIYTMLANYTFKGGTPKKLGDPGVPTIHCSIKGHISNTGACRGFSRPTMGLASHRCGRASTSGVGLASHESNREGERMYLASGWRQLQVSVNLGRLQQERARAEAEASLGVAVEACECTLVEAHEADCRCTASKDRHRV
ncbi:hypothetical protein ZWY2020_020712 [Hordeum vulgare]|nr:hypothetical protein ZWY2020_020712 [Hordeum vulgare]